MKKKLVGMAVVSALSLGAFVAGTPSGALAASKTVVKTTQASELGPLVDVNDALITSEIAALSEVTKAFSESHQVRKYYINEVYNVKLQRYDRERLYAIKAAEYDLERAKSNYNKATGKNKDSAKKNLDVALERYAKATKEAEERYKNAVNLEQKNYEKNLQLEEQKYSLDSKNLSNEKNKARETTGKAELENAINLVGLVNLKKGSAIETYADALIEANELSSGTLAINRDIAILDLDIQRTKGAISDSAYNKSLSEIGDNYKQSYNKLKDEKSRFLDSETNEKNRLKTVCTRSITYLKQKLQEMTK